MSLALKQARFASQGGRSGVVQQGGIIEFLKKTGGAAIKALTPFGGLLPSGRNRRPGVLGLELPSGLAGPSDFQRSLRATLPGGKTGFEGLKLACPSGFHPNKSSYFLMDGSLVEKGSRCVKNRRRNPMNPRALDRAISRVDSGKSLQGKLATITTAKWTAAGQRKEHKHG